jgi:hypothetical protein
MSGGYTFHLESAFARATGDRDWHARVQSPRLEQFQEMDLGVVMRGENSTRFFPYAIKSGIDGNGRWFSFNFKDGGDVPFDGTGDEIKLLCMLIYEAAK